MSEFWTWFIVAIVVIGCVIALLIAILETRRAARIDRDRLQEEARQSIERARELREKPWNASFASKQLGRHPAEPLSARDWPRPDAEAIRSSIRQREERRRMEVEIGRDRRTDDGFDHTGFAMGLATGMPISPARGVSGEAILGSILHAPSQPDPAPAASYSPPEPSTSTHESSTSFDSGSSSSGGGGGGGGD